MITADKPRERTLLAPAWRDCIIPLKFDWNSIKFFHSFRRLNDVTAGVTSSSLTVNSNRCRCMCSMFIVRVCEEAQGNRIENPTVQCPLTIQQTHFTPPHALRTEQMGTYGERKQKTIINWIFHFFAPSKSKCRYRIRWMRRLKGNEWPAFTHYITSTGKEGVDEEDTIQSKLDNSVRTSNPILNWMWNADRIARRLSLSLFRF